MAVTKITAIKEYDPTICKGCKNYQTYGDKSDAQLVTGVCVDCFGPKVYNVKNFQEAETRYKHKWVWPKKDRRHYAKKKKAI